MENVAVLAQNASSYPGSDLVGQDMAETSSSKDALAFISCHHFIGSVNPSSTPAHWHGQIEIIECVAGQGFTHISHGNSTTFDAPAIIIVPNKLIHRNCYPAKCRINTITFSCTQLQLWDQDGALEGALSQLHQGNMLQSIVITKNDQGFNEIHQLVQHLAYLSDPHASLCSGHATWNKHAGATSANQEQTYADALSVLDNAAAPTYDGVTVQSSDGVTVPTRDSATVTSRDGALYMSQYASEDLRETDEDEEEEAEDIGDGDIDYAALRPDISRTTSDEDEVASRATSNDDNAAASTLEGDSDEDMSAAAMPALHSKGTYDSSRIRQELSEYLHNTLIEMKTLWSHQTPEHLRDPLFDRSATNVWQALSNDAINPYNGKVKTAAINVNSIGIAVADSQKEQEDFARSQKELSSCKALGTILQIKATLLHLLGSLFSLGYLVPLTDKRHFKEGRTSGDKLREMLIFITKNHYRAISVSEMANLLGVTNQYFCRLFKQLTNVSFVEYVNDLRLQLAAIEIATTLSPINDISSRHGFENMSYFHRLFRARYHMRPEEYRTGFQDAHGRPIAEWDTLNGLMVATRKMIMPSSPVPSSASTLRSLNEDNDTELTPPAESTVTPSGTKYSKAAIPPNEMAIYNEPQPTATNPNTSNVRPTQRTPSTEKRTVGSAKASVKQRSVASTEQRSVASTEQRTVARAEQRTVASAKESVSPSPRSRGQSIRQTHKPSSSNSSEPINMVAIKNRKAPTRKPRRHKKEQELEGSYEPS